MKIVDHLYNTLRIDIANYRVRFCKIFENLLDLLIMGLWHVVCMSNTSRICMVVLTMTLN